MRYHSSKIRKIYVLARQRQPRAWIAHRALTIALPLILIWVLPRTAAAIVHITDDRGGNIGIYWSRYMALRDAGEQIVIDGTCSSACTLVLGIARMTEFAPPCEHVSSFGDQSFGSM